MTLSSTTRVLGTHNGLRSLLEGCDPEEFLENYIGDQMLYLSGGTNRFSDLFSWTDLNGILNGGFVSHPRARLMMKGTAVEPKLYTHEVHGLQWLDSTRCQRLMAQGATLIVLGVDQVNEKLATLVRELEHDFNATVEAEIVATFGHVPGLSVHWDSRECFNLQIAGEKEWRVTRPDRPHPLTPTVGFPERTDVTRNAAPDGPPTWSGVLKPGDLLYLPRGWWHAVRPQGVPSLHLNFAVDIPTVSDFIAWCAHQSKAHEMVRRIIPTWSTAPARHARAALALDAAAGTLSPDAIEAYVEFLGAREQPRPAFALPAGAAPEGPRLFSTTQIRTRSPRSLPWIVRDDVVIIVWKGQDYKCDARVVPALEKLNSAGTFTFDELSEGSEPVVIRAFVLAFIEAGAITVVGESDLQHQRFPQR